MTAFSQRSFRSPRGLSSRLRTTCGFLASACALSALSGCGLLNGPEQEPAPPITTLPTKPVFDPADNLTKGVPLPDKYRVTSVISGELLTIQGVKPVPGSTTQPPQYGVPETVRLAGIVAPAPGQPGWAETTAKVREWLRNKEDLTVETDAKFPIDLDSHRMVQIYFASGPATPDKPATGPQWNLNRMLIHTGYAVVDLYSATSIDVQKWLNDEEFAKTFVPDPSDTIDVVDPITQQTVKKPKIKPLGLWALGITIPQRAVLAPRTTTATATSPVATKSNSAGKPVVVVVPTAKSGANITTTRTKSSTRNVTTISPTARSSSTTKSTATIKTVQPANALPTPR